MSARANPTQKRAARAVATLPKVVLAKIAKSGLTDRDAAVMGLRFRTIKETLSLTKTYSESFSIPYFDVAGRPLPGIERTRLLDPPIGGGKYHQKWQGCRLYFCPLFDWSKILSDPAVPLYITEGELKAAKACKEGYACIGLGGVDNWGGRALDDLKAFVLKTREVVIVFDAPDSTENASVARALRLYAAELTRQDAIVSEKRLPDLHPPDKTGFDDFLVARGAEAFDALPVEPILKPQNITDLGNARRLIARHGADLRFVAARDSWLVWNGDRWRFDDGAEVMRRAKETVESIYGEAARAKDDALKAALKKWSLASESVAHLKAAVELARTEAEVHVALEALDADPWLLGVANGVVDLRTGKLRAARREDLITKCASVTYDPRAKCPTWERFLHRIMARNAHVIAFLRRAVGYSLTGNTAEKGLFFLYGPTGDNGKSTFVELLQTLLGEYARKVSAELLMVKRFANAGGARPDKIALIGRRLVVASELSDTQRFDESFLKDMVGGIDRIEARDLYEGTVNFKPEFKLWLYGNHRPQLRSDDDAAWNRLYLVPFDVTIPKAEQDRNLFTKLVAEAPGILNWALAGLADYRRAGLRPPRKVIAATDVYREDQDWFGRFLDETFIKDLGESSVTVGGAHETHVTWCKDVGIRQPLSEPAFRGQLAKHGFTWKPGHANKRYIQDLRARTKADDEADDQK